MCISDVISGSVCSLLASPSAELLSRISFHSSKISLKPNRNYEDQLLSLLFYMLSDFHEVTIKIHLEL